MTNLCPVFDPYDVYHTQHAQQALLAADKALSLTACCTVGDSIRRLHVTDLIVDLECRQVNTGRVCTRHALILA